MTGLRAFWMVLIGVVAGCALASTARAQDGLGGEAEIEFGQLGVGGAARAGSWVGVQVWLQSRETREIVLRIEARDADGDRPRYERVVTGNAGVTQSVWMYFYLPVNTHDQTLFRVSAYEAVESGETRSGYRAGRLLAEQPLLFQGGSLIGKQGTSSPAIIGYIGDRTVGLQRYEVLKQGASWAIGGHEPTRLKQLGPDDLPDRWMGLAPFDAIVWTKGQPQEVRPEQARALREWIERGGHLIVVLPSSGREWYTPLNNELYELMPAAAPVRLQDVDLETYRPLLVGRDLREGERPLSSRGVVHVFEPAATAEPGEAVRVIDGPDGRCVVVRRLIGPGAVTLVGIDLLDRTLTGGNEQLPRADVFWNRVLGRRGQAPTDAEIREAEDRGRGFSVSRDIEWIDKEAMRDAIAETGQAAKGVLLGFVLFAVYWGIAGPVGFAVLKRTKRAHHAWVFFVAAVALFTGIAWGGATLIRPKRVAANHLTMIAHVYGQPVQRARTWMSVLVPSYGQSTISVGEPDPEGGASARRRFHHAIAPWEPNETSGLGRAFPDARGYTIDSAQPDAISFPTRQTVKQFRADWAGLTPWGGMPRPVSTENEPKLYLMDEPHPFRVNGQLVHELPAPLHDVVVIVNRGQVSLGGSGTHQLLANAAAYKLTGDWAPGDPLVLEEVTKDNPGIRERVQRWADDLTPKTRGTLGTPSAAVNVPRVLQMLSIYPLLEPPPLSAGITDTPPSAVYRTETHGLDVGRWITQPCVIVLGLVPEDAGSKSPVPVYVNGREIEAKGLTMVMWVYPLPDDPPRYAGE